MNDSTPSNNLNKEGAGKTKSPVVAVMEEKVSVSKKVIDKATVRLSKTVEEHTESFEIPLSKEEVVVKRVSKNVIVDTMPEAVRYEGDVMIIPVLKEVVVVEKRMMLVEEIHVSKLKSENVETREVKVRTESVNVERTEIKPPGNDVT